MTLRTLALGSIVLACCVSACGHGAPTQEQRRTKLAGVTTVSFAKYFLEIDGGDSADDVGITVPDDTTVRVTDGVPMRAGVGCRADGDAVLCARSSPEVVNVEIHLGGGDDRFVVTPGPFAGTVDGGPGDDNLAGTARYEITLRGGAGNDTLTGASVSGGVGDDTLTSRGTGVLRGDAGDDQLVVTRSDERVTARGGPGDDVITGSPVGDRLRGGDGADRLSGGGGGDDLIGGRGADVVEGGAGSDVMPSDGADQLSGGQGDDMVGSIGSGRALDGGPGDDFLFARPHARVHGGPGVDAVYRSRADLAARPCVPAPTDFLYVSGRSALMFGRNHPNAATAFYACTRHTGHIPLRIGQGQVTPPSLVRFRGDWLVFARTTVTEARHDDIGGYDFVLFNLQRRAGRYIHLRGGERMAFGNPEKAQVRLVKLTASGVIAFVQAVGHRERLSVTGQAVDARLAEEPRGAISHVRIAGGRVTWRAGGRRHAARYTPAEKPLPVG